MYPRWHPSWICGCLLDLVSFHMPVQVAHRFSAREYNRMVETGLLPGNARVELLDGQINDMSPIGPFHGSVTKRLNRFFSQVAQDRWLVAVQDPIRLDDFSEPQPDLMLLKPSPDFYRSRHPGPEDVYLLIEIADASRDYDRAEKIPAYGRAHIPEVWLVDIEERVVEVYRQSGAKGYSAPKIVSIGDRVSPSAFPLVAVDVSELFEG
jgi:Uma2 family endonuclease